MRTPFGRLARRPWRIPGVAMRIVTLPGVFRPRPDSWMLARHLCARMHPGAHVLDLCTGSGAIAVAAARCGAGPVTAIDVSRRSVATVRINARLNGVRVRALRGDLFAPVARRALRRDRLQPALPARGGRRAAGARPGARDRRGHRRPRAPRPHLRPRRRAPAPRRRGAARALRPHRRRADRRGARGAAACASTCSSAAAARSARSSRARAPMLEARGLLAPGEREEEMVVVRGAVASA